MAAWSSPEEKEKSATESSVNESRKGSAQTTKQTNGASGWNTQCFSETTDYNTFMKGSIYLHCQVCKFPCRGEDKSQCSTS